MSIVGHNLLSKAVLEKGLTDPADILNAVNEWLAQTLHNNEDENSLSDGMDIAICSINRNNNVMSYAGAFNCLYCYRNNELIAKKGNRFPLGRFVNNTLNQFESVTFTIKPNDKFYIFSDGYVSQFGGPKGKKLMTGKFKAILKEIHTLPFPEQKKYLAKRMEEWKNTQEQVDDMLVIGFSV
jgi:serine phosphatase RsbU (regulator of sigma subunit)